MLEHFGGDHQTIAGFHDAAEADPVETAEADDLGAGQVVGLHVIGEHLRGRLAHDDARHQRHARHVAADPEFVFGDVAVADAHMVFDIVVDDRRERFHVVPLRNDGANRLDVGDDVVEIQRVGGHDPFT